MLDLKTENLYIEKNGFADLPCFGDIRYSQLRSFSYATAEQIANNRLGRLDDFKALYDAILDSQTYESYKDLRRTIIRSKEDELQGELREQLEKKEKERLNKIGLQSMKSIK